MPGQLSILSIWLSLSFSLCHAYVDFIFPGMNDDKLTFNYIDVVYFTWSSSVDSPWMNLWCAPSPRQPQSKSALYHEQVPTNGTNAQSFPYGGYNQKGLCHMQVEDFSGDDHANSPVFNITSNDGVAPSTWGLNELGAAGGSPAPTSAQQIQALGAVPSSVLAAATSLASSSAATKTLFLATLGVTGPISISTSLTSSTSGSTTPPTPGASHSGLGIDAEVAITIGSFVALFIAGLLFAVFWSRRIGEGRRQRSEPRYVQQQIEWKMSELEGGSNGGCEMNGDGMLNELHGTPQAELSGDTRALMG